MIEIKVPIVGESISEVTLLKWLKKDGEYVDRDDVIAELESEKATFEVNAEQSGVIKIIAKEGDTLAIGAVLANIDEKAKQPATATAASAENNQPAKAKGLSKPQVVSIEEPNEQEAAKNKQQETGDKQQATSNKQAEILTDKAVPAGKGMIELKVPSVGESINEVTLLKWMKSILRFPPYSLIWIEFRCLTDLIKIR